MFLMTTNPGRLLSRDRLLDAVTQQGSDKNDRSIDFLVNRLRRKLDDDARHPRFIETRYGEGYVWIGRSDLLDRQLAGTYLVIGPLLGLENLGDRASLAKEFAADLCSAAEARLSPEQRVALVPDLPHVDPDRDNFPRLSFGLTFFSEVEDVYCIVTARYFATGQILTARRFLLGKNGERSQSEMAGDAVETLLDESWRVMSTSAGLGVPLPVAMDVSAPGSPSGEAPSTVSDRELLNLSLRHEKRKLKVWVENEARLAHLRRADPDDPILKIMHATHIHTRYVAFGHDMFLHGEDSRATDEDVIERLTLEALPFVQSQPEYAIAAAKLLHFVNRGYFELAQDLAEKAYKASVSVSTSLATIGQLRAFAGETQAALHCIDQALNLVERGSVAHTYTLVLKCQALVAVRDYDRLQDAKQQLCANVPTAFIFAEPLCSDPDNLTLRARTVAMLLSRARARSLLMHFHYISARLFCDPDHGANTIRAMVNLFAGRFGPGVVPEEVTTAFPWLLPAT